MLASRIVVITLPLLAACTPLRALDPIDDAGLDARASTDTGAPTDAGGGDAAIDAFTTDVPGLDARALDAGALDAGAMDDAPAVDAYRAPDVAIDAPVPPSDGGMGCTIFARAVSCTTPGTRTFVVPEGVRTLHLSAVGAGGGGYDGTDGRRSGGRASFVETDLMVMPSTTLLLVVGAGGGGSPRSCGGGAGGGGGLSGVLHDAGRMLLVAAGGGGATGRTNGCPADMDCSTSADSMRPPGNGFGGGGAGSSGGSGGRGEAGVGYPIFAGGASPCAGASGGAGGGGGGGVSIITAGGGGGGSGWPGGPGGAVSGFMAAFPGHGGTSACSTTACAVSEGAAGGDPGAAGEGGMVSVTW